MFLEKDTCLVPRFGIALHLAMEGIATIMQGFEHAIFKQCTNVQYCGEQRMTQASLCAGTLCNIHNHGTPLNRGK